MWFNGFCGGISLAGMPVDSKKKLNKFKNAQLFQNTFARLIEDALERYHFDGLPETISERALLMSLLWYGAACIFEKGGNLFALPCAPTGDGYNVYGDPGSVFVYSYNGFSEKVPVFIHGSDEASFLRRSFGGATTGGKKGVFVRENALCFPFINQVVFFASAIADTMRTLDVCRVNIKRPYFVVCEESVRPTVERYFRERDENNEAIISSGIFDADKVSILPIQTNAESLTACTQLIEWYESKYRELCGIENNSQMDKKGENLISDEISVNDDYTAMGPQKSVTYIQQALDDANKLFGTSITVKAREMKEDMKDDELLGKSEKSDISGDKGSNT